MSFFVKGGPLLAQAHVLRVAPIGAELFGRSAKRDSFERQTAS